MLLVIIAGLVFSNLWQSRANVLAYATSMSRSGLLSSTNQKRAANGVASLALNSKLNNAAQAKANHMVAHDYWSHNTPSGDPPWVFIDNAGYNYTKAGENLAYGFATSADTVTGWMNSPSHKANMLDKGFTEVGFGFANSTDFVDSGQQTIVVAMYAKPVGAATPAPVPTPAASQPAPKPQTKAAEQTAPAPVKEKPAKKETSKKTEEKPKEEASQAPVPLTTESNLPPPPQTVSRLSVITGGALPWVTSAVLALGIGGLAFFVLRHGWTVRRWIIQGERYVMHHVAFDIAIIGLIGLSFIATRSAGIVM